MFHKRVRVIDAIDLAAENRQLRLVLEQERSNGQSNTRSQREQHKAGHILASTHAHHFPPDSLDICIVLRDILGVRIVERLTFRERVMSAVTFIHIVPLQRIPFGFQCSRCS